MTLAVYVNMLSNYFINRAKCIHPEVFYFKQDNAAPHTAKATYDWFEEERLAVMDWSARPPDLNPRENLRGDLVMEVYENSRQYEDGCDLVQAINKAWRNISSEHC